ncbi:Basic helix-loop-helix type transcription factor HLH54F [Operophtera brumata]|uniref:Basic helix-loop-helix type transcription factor HLH54F n=1 Tax=Operophtera brumata TaxID=104452 RepID=A0A0L7LA44_OPEBR|nr:Basic helix-loop-helix type transcription factor HLH54F [Operophtera brumata]
MPRKRVNRSPPAEKRSEDGEDDDFFFDDTQLKTTLPWVPADTKLSKLDTLRLAASYIAHLRALLHEPRSAHTPPHPLSLHGGSLSCGISQRWSINQDDAQSCRNNTSRENNQDHQHYTQEYSENDYDERGFEDASGDQTQFCNYGYKENYYEMRNSYSSENLMNT